MSDASKLNRRGFLGLAAGGAAGGLLAGISDSDAAPSNGGGTTFMHGVASGDPTQNSVLLWTRVTPITPQDPDNILTHWIIARDEELQNVVQQGQALAKRTTDYTLTIDVEDLAEGTIYFYRFFAKGHISRTGRTKTLPGGSPEGFQMAVVSCANYASGFFNAYRDIADAEDIDLVVHLGDYIYEEGTGGFGTQDAGALDRVPFPNKELVTLPDYRTRYAQYRADPALQDLHARVPFVCIWDDHEIVNGSWSRGSLDHLVDEMGSWKARRDAAMQAYHEWLPLRLSKPDQKDRIFRSFRVGDLFQLTLLDTRHFGRERLLARPQGMLDYITNEMRRRFDKRDVLGDAQEKWFGEEIAAGGSARWHLVGQQFLVTPLDLPDLAPLIDLDASGLMSRSALEGVVSFSQLNPLFLTDSWEGYENAKKRFLTQLSNSKSVPVVLTGDIHTAICADLTLKGDVIAHELVTPSISSPGLDQIFPSVVPGAVAQGFKEQNPDLHYIDGQRRGWLHLDICAQEVTADWRYVSTIKSEDFSSASGQRATIYREGGGRTGRLEMG